MGLHPKIQLRKHKMKQATVMTEEEIMETYRILRFQIIPQIESFQIETVREAKTGKILGTRVTLDLAITEQQHLQNFFERMTPKKDNPQ